MSFADRCTRCTSAGTLSILKRWKRPLGQTAKFRWEFRKDHTCEMSVDANYGIVPVPGVHGTVKSTWKVLEVRGDTLTIELSTPAGPGKATVAFNSMDNALFDAGGG